ncbi:response regulator [Herbaspirillum seropedicae]|uniref:response regulator n=1 Tax=Herbaspirillum seropedicae TaxID=964 RepID=UPI001FD13A42|nr:response regulator [Herbaspirillum seropedicae]
MPSSRGVIALIDDDQGVRTALCNLLDSAGYRSCSFSSGEDFLASDCLALAVCAIIDLQLACMSGFELAERLALARPDLPLLFISAQATARQQQRASALGGALLAKPVDGETLLALLVASVLYGRP